MSSSGGQFGLDAELLAAAVSHLAEGVLITSDHLEWPGPQIVFVNEAMCRISGYAAEELIGQTPRILQGSGSDRETLDRIKAELSAGRSCSVELINYRKDGTCYDAELFITPLSDRQGHRTNFVSIHRDISDRKRSERALRESEERLRAILNTATDAIINIDRRGTITHVNPATVQLFGYAADELVGHNVSMLMPTPYRDEHDDYIARYLETREPRIIGIGREVTGMKKDGSLFPVDLAVSEVDHMGLFTGVIRDISERKLLQGELLTIAADEQRRIGQELHDSTQQQITGLGLLAQNVAEALKKLSESDEEADLPSRLARLHERAVQVQHGLEQAAHEVSDLSHGLMPVEVDAHGLMAALTELARSINDAHAVECTFTHNGPIEVADNVTATHFYRIAQEAVNNALKHSAAQRIEIVLEELNGSITLKIVDDGAGIDENRPESSGMGLKIMAYRAELIGGTLTVNHVDGGGTEVVCRALP